MKRVAALALCALLGTLGVLQLLGNGGLIGWVLAGFLLLGARIWLRPRPGDLARVGKGVAALVAFVALFVASLFIAWESAEVVVLRYTDEQQRPVESRLWVVDLDGVPSVAMGSAKKRVPQIQARPQVELVRGGRTECRRGVVFTESGGTREDKRRAEGLFEEKYGLRLQATRALRLVFGAEPGEEPVLIRLEPCV